MRFFVIPRVDNCVLVGEATLQQSGTTFAENMLQYRINWHCFQIVT